MLLFFTIALIVAVVVNAQEKKFRTIRREIASRSEFAFIAEVAWNYDYNAKPTCNGTVADKCGPKYWGNIVPALGKVNMCNGLSQTPINISVNADVDKNLLFPKLNVTAGGCKKYASFCDDHAFEVSFSEPGHECTNAKLYFKGSMYTLLQFHFHSLSEHTYKGDQTGAEVLV
jgi:carbonic anhydrase